MNRSHCPARSSRIGSLANELALPFVANLRDAENAHSIFDLDRDVLPKTPFSISNFYMNFLHLIVDLVVVQVKRYLGHWNAPYCDIPDELLAWDQVVLLFERGCEFWWNVGMARRQRSQRVSYRGCF